MTEPIILADDLVSSGMKIALITVSGRVLGCEAEPIQLMLTADEGVKQSPDEWRAASLSAFPTLIPFKISIGLEGCGLLDFQSQGIV